MLLIIGKIYDKQCPHCVSLEPEWNQMKDKVQLHMGRDLDATVEFTEIENVRDENGNTKVPIETRLSEFNQKHEKKHGKIDRPVELQGGFPTLFCIYKNKVTYFDDSKQDRTKDNLYKWVTAHCGKKGGEAAEAKDNKKANQKTKEWTNQKAKEWTKMGKQMTHKLSTDVKYVSKNVSSKTKQLSSKVSNEMSRLMKQIRKTQKVVQKKMQHFRKSQKARSK